MCLERVTKKANCAGDLSLGSIGMRQLLGHHLEADPGPVIVDVVDRYVDNSSYVDKSSYGRYLCR